jgi:hypothetical protein
MAKAHTLVDNFNDDTIDQYHALNNPDGRWNVTASDRIRETNGRVEMRPPASQGSVSLEYASAVTYDLTDSEVRVELVRPLIRSSRTSTGLAAYNSAGTLSIVVYRGLLYASITQGSTTNLAKQPYDAVRHRWLRLREDEGTVYWEFSPDGEEWTTLASRSPHPFDLTALTLRIRAGISEPVEAPGMAIFDNFNVRNTSVSRRVEERRISARGVRDRAAALAESRRHEEHANNNDETNYLDLAGRQLAGMYSKSLRHDALGDPDPVSYVTLLRALESRDPHDFEEIQLASATAIKLTNPQAGLAFDVAGPDAQAFTMPPAPRFDSEQAAHEAGELYWMAVARDIPFINWAAGAATSGSVIQRAISSLQSEFQRFGGTTPTNDAKNLFRGVFPGEQMGPYVSQFLLKGNNDRRRRNLDGIEQDARDGYISYGSQVIDQRQLTVFGAPTIGAAADYLTTFSTWLDVQNGVDKRGEEYTLVPNKDHNRFDPTPRFIRNLRDGASYVHFDQVINAFYNAAMILLTEPVGDQLDDSTARPMIDLEFPKDQGNPYDPPGTTLDSRTQVGFGTFGPIHLLQVLSEVLGRTIRGVWWQKWGVHRRLRPEEYGGRVDNWIAGRRDYPLDPDIKTSLTTGLLRFYYGGQSGDEGPNFPSYLLPQAYPEGAPTHPAYGAGHAAGSGACATILKAFFDESKGIENPVQANFDGTALVAYTGDDDAQLTVGGELNKLAGNIAIFRNAAGVHWRSDYTESLPFGEAIAIGLLQEMSLGFNEDDAYFELTKFDGQKIRIFDGKVVPVVV